MLIIDGGAVILALGGVRENGEGWLCVCVCVSVGGKLSLKAGLNTRFHKNMANYCVNAKEIRSITEM